jgi:hypothetical protein
METLWCRAVTTAALVRTEVLAFEPVAFVGHLGRVPVLDGVGLDLLTAIEAMVQKVLVCPEARVYENVAVTLVTVALGEFDVGRFCLCPHGWLILYRPGSRTLLMVKVI